MFEYSDALAEGKSIKEDTSKQKAPTTDQDGLYFDEKEEDTAIADYASAIAGGGQNDN